MSFRIIGKESIFILKKLRGKDTALAAAGNQQFFMYLASA
jgi:hypothetical protein